MALSIDYRVEEILATLQENRETHMSLFIDTLRGWEVDVKEAWEAFIKADPLGDKKEFDKASIKFTNELHNKPRSQEKDYDRAIAMLEKAQEQGQEYVNLNEESFRNFIEDDWDWTQNFTVSNTRYGGKFKG